MAENWKTTREIAEHFAISMQTLRKRWGGPCGFLVEGEHRQVDRWFICTNNQHPSYDGLNFTSLTTAALCRHGVELLPILQNLSIDVHQNIVCFLNKFIPTPFVRNPSSCFHQSDVLIFKRHKLYAVN